MKLKFFIFSKISVHVHHFATFCRSAAKIVFLFCQHVAEQLSWRFAKLCKCCRIRTRLKNVKVLVSIGADREEFWPDEKLVYSSSIISVSMQFEPTGGSAECAPPEYPDCVDKDIILRGAGMCAGAAFPLARQVLDRLPHRP